VHCTMRNERFTVHNTTEAEDREYMNMSTRGLNHFVTRGRESPREAPNASRGLAKPRCDSGGT
jgi:hypothetical protein